MSIWENNQIISCKAERMNRMSTASHCRAAARATARLWILGDVMFSQFFCSLREAHHCGHPSSVSANPSCDQFELLDSHSYLITEGNVEKLEAGYCRSAVLVSHSYPLWIR